MSKTRSLVAIIAAMASMAATSSMADTKPARKQAAHPVPLLAQACAGCHGQSGEGQKGTLLAPAAAGATDAVAAEAVAAAIRDLIGDVIEVRTLIDHPMETGLRKDANGQIVPRDMLVGFVARANGGDVFSATFRNATSAHPYLVFHARIDGPTEFEFVWTHEDGRTVRATASVATT